MRKPRPTKTKPIIPDRTRNARFSYEFIIYLRKNGIPVFTTYGQLLSAKAHGKRKTNSERDVLVGLEYFEGISNGTLKEYKVRRSDLAISTGRDFQFISGGPIKSLANKISNRVEKVVESEAKHDKIQKLLTARLSSTHGVDSVGWESDTGLRTRVDVVLNVGNQITLYEVKSYSSLTESLRVAIGQLLEYAFFPNPIKNLKELIIVSHVAIDSVHKEYLGILRKETGLNLFYQSINLETGEMSKKS